jgi:RNA polymerase sigma factor for flagellar operon FliA
MIEKFSPLVKMVALKIYHRLPSYIDIDDLISTGIVGLIDAIDKFDPKKSKNFKKYAEIRIRGAILDELRNLDWISRSTRKKTSRMNEAKGKLEMKLGRPPSDEELARELDLDMDGFHDLMNQIKPAIIVSFEDYGITDSDDKRSLIHYLRDPAAADPMKVAHFNRVRSLLAEMISSLPEKQKFVITLYYFEDMNLKEIGQVLDLTESRVSQLHSQAVRTLNLKLRKFLEQE